MVGFHQVWIATRVGAIVAIQMAIVGIVVPIITSQLTIVTPVVAVKQVHLDQHLLLLALRHRRHHLLKKVMEVRVLQVVNVLRVCVVDLIVVAVIQWLSIGALIVIQMVTVPLVVSIITEVIISVMPVVAAKQVHRVRHRLHLVLLLKKVMEVLALPTVNVPPARVVDPIVAVVKEDLVGALIVIRTAIAPVVAPIITEVVINVMPKKVTEARVLLLVNVPPARVVDPIVVVVKEDPVDALIVIQMAIVPVVAPIITCQINNVPSVVVVKQAQLDLLHPHLALKLTGHHVPLAMNVHQVPVQDLIVAAPKENLQVASIVIQTAIALVVVPIILMQTTNVTLVKQVHIKMNRPRQLVKRVLLKPITMRLENLPVKRVVLIKNLLEINKHV